MAKVLGWVKPIYRWCTLVWKKIGSAKLGLHIPRKVEMRCELEDQPDT